MDEEIEKLAQEFVAAFWEDAATYGPGYEPDGEDVRQTIDRACNRRRSGWSQEDYAALRGEMWKLFDTGRPAA